MQLCLCPLSRYLDVICPFCLSSFVCCFFPVFFQVNRLLLSVFHFISYVYFLFVPLLIIYFSCCSRAKTMHSQLWQSIQGQYYTSSHITYDIAYFLVSPLHFSLYTCHFAVPTFCFLIHTSHFTNVITSQQQNFI